MGKKSKAQKAAAAQTNGAKPESPPSPLPPPGFFPFASYTSVVGVHTTLLAFSALFLPRTTELVEFLKPTIDPTQLTSRDRPQHPFLDALTISPVATLACLCIGAVVLQSWWGGWVRGWGIDFALHGTGIERQMDRGSAETRKLSNLRDAWLTTAASSTLFYAIIVFMGAPLASHVWQTALLAILLSLLVVFPPAYALGSPLSPDAAPTWTRLFAELKPRTPVERAMLYPAVGTIVGCWLGVIPIALDWDRPWQAWPLTPALGAVLGYILASVGALTANAVAFFADAHRRALYAEKIK
ncbi:GPI biosynthesis protein family Pig-F-domain-containing protein, partial [Mycena galericulata]